MRAAIKSHPAGLFVLAGTELWDRISFHGMQALLVLYMVGQLFRPGHVEHIVGFSRIREIIQAVTGPLSTQALAAQIFGLYVGLIYLTPVFGGILGDRFISRRFAVTSGALLMTAGHFCMAFDSPFFLGLLLLIVGAGVLRGNLMAQIGELYSKGDGRRNAAFQIYYAILNMGAFVAPLITGWLAQDYGWHYGFGFAGFGMLAGLLIYLAGGRTLAPEIRRDARNVRVPLDRSERRTVFALASMMPVLTLYWIGQSQTWNVYNFWVRDHVDLFVVGRLIPIPWLQAFGSLAVILVMPLIVWFWRWQAKHGLEPDDLTKIAIGCLIFAVAMTWLAAGGPVAGASNKVPLAWALGFQTLASASYIYVTPPFVALISRSAPASVNAMMVGSASLDVFAGSTISGRLGGLYERLTPAQFWLIHAGIVALAGLVIFLCAPQLRRTLAPVQAEPALRREALT